MSCEDISSTAGCSSEESEMEVVGKHCKVEKIPKASRKTLPIMTKYEKARVIGVRAEQISAGAPLFIDVRDETDPLKIASAELREKKLPFIIRRGYPDGSFEEWEIDELMIPGVDF